MVRLALLVAVLAVACNEHGKSPTGGVDAPLLGKPDAALESTCPQPGAQAKIKFTRASSCGNDGSVEFCIPDNNQTVKNEVAMIAPTVHCAAGGGRAMCNVTPGFLLCTFPLAFPADCLEAGGAMTDQAWGETCALAALPEVPQIVPTIFE